ncbi:CoA pyrophosphatase [Leucobacter zeae]|nr:CoA pyrophosphatase [Leucobacter zeae]
MSTSVADAQRDLRDLLARGVELDFRPQGDLIDRPLRRSAVLILFGALDDVPARTAAPASTPRAMSAGVAPTPGSAPESAPPDLDVLLTLRADRMRHHAGQIAFPGGGVEPEDDGRAATALREAAEETGLDPTGVEIIGCLPEAHIPVSNNLVTPVVGWWCRPSEVAADRSESVEVFRVPVAELLDPRARGTSVLRRGGLVHRGAAFELGPRFGGRIVWGFTGILLATLFDQLGWSRPWDPMQEFAVDP